LSTADTDSRHPTCSSFVYPRLATTRISVPAGACLSFERYSDVTAVITAVRPANSALFTTLDVLTYRGRPRRFDGRQRPQESRDL